MGWLQGFGPVRLGLPPLEIGRAALGAAVGLMLADAALWGLGAGQTALLAPFGASAFLLFTVPGSPLAQPWPAVVGNTVSALVALTVLLFGLPQLVAMCLSVLLAIVAMSLTRSMHPPGGAVAIATMLAAPSFGFAFCPVAAGTAALVLAAWVWHFALGRAYPYRPHL